MTGAALVRPAELLPEPGWEPITHIARPGGLSFVRADASTERLFIRYWRRSTDGALVGKVWFGPLCQGPPEHAHGGSMAAVLDDAMGISAWIAGHAVVAAGIDVRFRNMLPLGTVAALEASVASLQGRKVQTRGKLVGPDGVPFATAEGLFVALGTEKFHELGARQKAPPGSGSG